MLKRIAFSTLVFTVLLSLLFCMFLKPLRVSNDFHRTNSQIAVSYNVTTTTSFPSVLKIQPSLGWIPSKGMVSFPCWAYLDVRLAFSNGMAETAPVSSRSVYDQKILRCEPEMLEHALSNLEFRIPAELQARYYRYPYDSLTLKLDTELVVEGAEKPIRFKVGQLIDAYALDGWDVHVLAGHQYRKIIVLERPLALRILLPIILFALCLLIPSILLIEQIGDAIGVAIALALGIWGIRQAAVPSHTSQLLAIEVVLLGDSVAIFVALVGSVVVELSHRYTKLRKNSRALPPK